MSTEEMLKNLILSRYKSIADFSDYCGIKYTTIMSILNRGVNNASITNIIKICQTLGISADELAAGNIVYQKAITYKKGMTLEELLAFIEGKLDDGSLTFNGSTISQKDSDAIKTILRFIPFMLNERRETI